MEGDTPTQEDGQKLWDELAKEREAEESPSTPAVIPTDEPDTPDEEPESADDKGGEQPAESKEDKGASTNQGLSPELLARLDRLEQLEKTVQVIPQLQNSLKTAEGRVAAMQREMDVAKNAAKSVGNAPTQAQMAAAAGSTEKWRALKEDFPEWGEATEEFVKAQLAGLTPQQTQGVSPEQLNQMVEQRMQQERRAVQKAIEEAKVEGRHEDWQTVIKGQDFKAWFDKQPADIQRLAFSPKGRDAIQMIDLFKTARDKPVERVNQQRANKLAAAVNTKPAPGAVRKSLDQMSPKELWDYEASRKRKGAGSHGLSY